MNPEEMAKAVQDISIELGKHSIRLDTISDEVKEAKDQGKEIAKLVESMHELALSVKEIAFGEKSNSENIGRLQTNIDEIQKVPSRRWETVVAVFITALITVGIEFFVK